MNFCGNFRGCNILYFSVIFVLHCCVLNACLFQPDSSVRCELLLSERCNSLYGDMYQNATSFPNVYGHENQASVELFLKQKWLIQLMDSNCSPFTPYLICLAVYPLCYHEQFNKVEPCREMCVQVRDSCTPVLPNPWPEELNCNQFPTFGSKLCVSNEDTNCAPIPSITVTADSHASKDVTPSPGELRCNGRLFPLKNSISSFGGKKDCLEPCHGVYFEQYENTLLTICGTSLSVINFLVSVFILFTYIINFKSIHQLERPIYYISLCYAFLGLSSIISRALGRDFLICDLELQNSFNQSVLVAEGLSHPLCSTLFSVAYYFTLCSWVWWCALTFQWFFFNMGKRNISLCVTTALHVFVWGTPFLFLLIALGTRKVSGDPVTQTCWIHKNHEVPFVIVPLAASLLFCSSLILIRFATVLRHKNKTLLHLDRGNTNDINGRPPKPSSLFKTSLYIIVFLAVMGILFCCYFYNFWYREAWEKFYLMCNPGATLKTCNLLPKSSKPSLPVFLAQICTSICMGPLTILWVLREDLMKPWMKACGVLCTCRRPRELRFESSRTPETIPGESDIKLKDVEPCDEAMI